MKKIEILPLFLIILIGLILRLQNINRPIADWHSWRQADTAAVARNFIKEGYNPFIPKYDDMSSQSNGIDNPNRYRFVEFPIYNSLIAVVWSFTSYYNIAAARLVTVFISLGSVALLYFIVRFYSSWQTAALSSFFFTFIPYNIFYSTVILPAPLMVFFILAAYLTFIKWLEKENSWGYLLLSSIFTSCAILTWPIALFFTLPLVYLVFNKFGLASLKQFKLWIFLALALLPFIAWRIWITNFPEGIPNWRFLLNENNIRFKGAFFRWLIVERLGRLILSVSGFTLLVIGIIKKPNVKEKYFYYSWLLGGLLYVSVFASGNIRHDYYQIPLIPILSIYLALGTKFILDLPSQYISKVISRLIIILLVLFTFAFGYFEIRGFYWINKPQIVEAGKAVDRLLPPNATVIAPYNGDAAFLYQTNRNGYPIVDRPLEEYIDQGTKYLVSVDTADSGIQNLATHCKVIEKKDNYVIIEMFKDCIGK
ncbi:hypothetical protein A2164_04290 [Candidatus Curtissbacteria bacterium RBG_13_35_7]|uniref:Glycosyltransferase RgtA/B/C/D-like domain-containing protein n=1 Tax=Candidatus Curtissbacteria bacterium RBG_13_35_7 TaxID=1797705 RepID=A0A1F5G5I3_9BACT|nr:MAG: hypothetical protein A2164_04290 [Candidatus Curtissbacteria bacterium RBG_13_35_7]